MRIDINTRQKQILSYLAKLNSVSTQEILDYLVSSNLSNVSRPTINRDVEELVEIEFLRKEGSGPTTKYALTPKAKLLTIIDPKAYFDKASEERDSYNSFNWQIFNLITSIDIFSEAELKRLEQLQDEYQSQKSNLSETIIHKEIERVTIELSWKSSKIEGNTYSLLETENLLKNGLPAAGKSDLETQMILNHKEAIDSIFNNSNEFKILNISHIEHIHSILVEKLNISIGIRKTLVGITGTIYKPLDNEHQIREALTKVINMINSLENTFIKSLLTILLISYIQPFEDGNKRTSRILGNAILLAWGAFPLSFRNVDEVRYKEATLLFYEQNNLSLFKAIFLEQSEFSVRNYFRSTTPSKIQ